MFEWLRDWLARARPEHHYPTLALTPDGFIISHHDGTTRKIAWDAVAEIHAFKWSLAIYDTILIEFQMADGAHWTIDEDWPGYEAVMQEMERRFPLTEDWWSTIDGNRTLLWSASTRTGP